MRYKLEEQIKKSPRVSLGFSLVELLVVIAIIAILGAILIPMTNRIRTTAQRTECASNMRQVWQGTLLYVNEHNGELPKDRGYTDFGPWKIDGQRTRALVGWVAYLLQDYVPDETWFCPDPIVVGYSQIPGKPNFGAVWRQRPYETDKWKYGAPYHRDTPLLLSTWENLPEKYVFCCMPIMTGGGAYYAHAITVNFLAMDGHVENIHYGK